MSRSVEKYKDYCLVSSNTLENYVDV